MGDWGQAAVRRLAGDTLAVASRRGGERGLNHSGSTARRHGAGEKATRAERGNAVRRRGSLLFTARYHRPEIA